MLRAFCARVGNYENVYICWLVKYGMWNFRKLDVWKRSFDLVEEVYRLVRGFPKEEVYGLGGQLRRAVVSISSNIAEGCGRRTSKDFVGFLHNASGSTKEVESQLLVAER